MSASCGHDVSFDGTSAGYRRALWAVIALNATMFVVEITAGALAGSQALRADGFPRRCAEPGRASGSSAAPPG